MAQDNIKKDSNHFHDAEKADGGDGTLASQEPGSRTSGLSESEASEAEKKQIVHGQVKIIDDSNADQGLLVSSLGNTISFHQVH